MKLTITVELPDDADPELVDGYCVAVTAIARQLFPPVWTKIDRGDIVEPIRGIDDAGNSGRDNHRVGIGISDTHHHIHVREERGVESVRSTAVGRDRRRSPGEGQGVARQPGRAESGSDRLSGPPEGTTEGGTMALHRGRRRRLLDRLKRVGAGRRFKR